LTCRPPLQGGQPTRNPVSFHFSSRKKLTPLPARPESGPARSQGRTVFTPGDVAAHAIARGTLPRMLSECRSTASPTSHVIREPAPTSANPCCCSDPPENDPLSTSRSRCRVRSCPTVYTAGREEQERVDPTEERMATARRFGRSDRRALLLIRRGLSVFARRLSSKAKMPARQAGTEQCAGKGTPTGSSQVYCGRLLRRVWVQDVAVWLHGRGTHRVAHQLADSRGPLRTQIVRETKRAD
jgi:hypothetical protein